MKIYTRNGDKGKTRLIGGSQVSKSHLRIQSYGSVDELNSQIGLIIALMIEPEIASLKQQFLRIQSELFNVGSLLACEDDKIKASLPVVTEEHVHRLELDIDEMTSQLPALTNFILPGGHILAAQTHIARALCRRAERNTVELFEVVPDSETALIYLNRLSDYLFTAARWLNMKMQIPDIAWLGKNQK